LGAAVSLLVIGVAGLAFVVRGDGQGARNLVWLVVLLGAIGLIGLAGAGDWPSWHGRVALVVASLFLLTLLELVADAVLDWRGEATEMQVTDRVTKEEGAPVMTNSRCELRRPDNTSLVLDSSKGLFRQGQCDANIQVGDRMVVYEDPEGLVAPRSFGPLVSVGQLGLIAGGVTIVLMTLTAEAAVRSRD
jgi:hypothetical protein